MQGNRDVLVQLDVLLCNELTAINQYFLHARMLKNWGFIKLGDHEYKESIEEMKHADLLIERILMLNGNPDPQKMSKIVIGKDVPKILASDLALEKAAHTDLVHAVTLCDTAHDYVTKEIVQTLLDDTEEHIDYLETQLELLEKVGLQNYLMMQV